MTTFTIEEMRSTILGNTPWASCLQCNATGVENWNEEGEDVRSGPTDAEDRIQGECENCEGLGYIVRSD
jgi:hypothetical protein